MYPDVATFFFAATSQLWLECLLKPHYVPDGCSDLVRCADKHADLRVQTNGLWERALAQAADEDNHLVWSPVSHIPHRNLEERTSFVVLETANGTSLTLSGTHMVYLLDAAPGSRVPAPARDVKVRG